MAKQTKYTVHAGYHIARFSDYQHAMRFAIMVSQDGHFAEVSAKDGLVGQYDNGVTTPEFRLHHDGAFADRT